MSKLDEYKEKKRIEALGLPTMWIVKSTKETGVEEPYEVQTKEIFKIGTRRYNDKPNIDVYCYRLVNNGYPYEVDIEEGAISGISEGYGTGFGDLWVWTYYSSLSKEDAFAYYEKEKRRLENKSLLKAIEIVLETKPHHEILEKFAREKYNERFTGEKTPYNAFHYYSRYNILDNNTIAIEYKYGAGDMEFDDSFDVKID